MPVNDNLKLKDPFRICFVFLDIVNLKRVSNLKPDYYGNA